MKTGDMASAIDKTAASSTDHNQDIIDQYQRKVADLIAGADEEMIRGIKTAIEQAVQTVLHQRGELALSGCVEAALQEADRSVLRYVEAQAHAFSKTAEPESSSSLVSAIGAFIAQAAIGGAEVPTMLREEEGAYNAQSAVLPLRRLAESTAAADADAGGGRHGGDPALAGDHVHPSEEGACFAEGAKRRARDVREAQQEDLIRHTGDALYPASEGDQQAPGAPGGPSGQGMSTGGLQEEGPSAASAEPAAGHGSTAGVPQKPK